MLSVKYSGYENRVGAIDIKSSSVHFYVKRNTFFSTTSAIIPFQVEHLNIGGAMNLTTGVFTVPVYGVYHFEFSAMKDASNPILEVHLQVNGIALTRAEMNHGTTGSFDSVSLTASFQLRQYDTLNLFNKNGVLYDGFDTDFAGWLVEEDISI